jgi:hypothetical protein
VFGRGVEITSDDPDTAEILREFLEDNKNVLGQNALTELDQRKWYDGNLFWAFFTDQSTGKVTVRTIDATEIQEVLTDPEDSDTPWFYKRTWTQKPLSFQTGNTASVTMTKYYPAVGFDPQDGERPEKINGADVVWDVPVYHRKCGGVAKWRFGCPRFYAAIDWAKACTDFLSACMTIRQALAQFALLMSTKGGQQAIEGAKAQLGTTVGPSASLWDQNPPAVVGASFVSGSGVTLEAFKTQGAGGNPDDVRQYKLMVAMTFGLPESFFGDMNTSNLATATSLDRPTELMFKGQQEEWAEDLTVISSFALSKSLRAPNGKLREAIVKRNGSLDGVRVREAAYQMKDGRRLYEKRSPTKGTSAYGFRSRRSSKPTFRRRSTRLLKR